MFNRKLEDFVNKSLFDIFPNQREAIEEYLKINRKIIETGIGRQYEMTFDIDNKPQTFLINDQAVKDSEGKGIYVVSSSIEITERKLFEQRLKESEEKFRNIAEQSLMGIFIIQDDVIKYANKRMAEINGYSLEEILNWQPKEHYKTLSPESLAFVEEQGRIQELGNSDISSQYPLQIIRKTGEKMWVENFSKIITYEGKPANFITLSDITDRKELDQKLKESEDKYHLLFNNSPIGIGLSTIEGQIIEFNEAIRELTGYTKEELNQLGIPTIYSDQNERVKAVKILREVGYLRDHELKFKRKDGTEFYGSLSLDLVEMNGLEIIQSTLKDITDKKEVELELRKLNNLKSELLRRTSHELKTPLVSIKGFSDLLLEVHRDKLDYYVISTIDEIKQGCLRLEALISDILKTAELESGVIKLVKSREDLSFLIRLCVNEVRGFSDLRNHSLELEIPENLELNFEKEQIHQVINNLINNAIKYTPKNGKIQIKSQIQNEKVLISVKDNGIGLSLNEKSQLFKQFGKIERFGQGLDVIPDGSGLGLYISKKIVELHGGEIWVESEGKNKGSTFYFTLPLHEN
ncbi:hypothetical protein LCGC14_1580500 [marine sediment metagenome]|uniref:histidine kinase n=1 Tax=marine sediment metagenome TaxID=412755 RepID=A0A0F9IH66_9ZZZZ